MDAGTRNVYSNKPVTKPADLKGMKIRMMGNPIFVETMNAMGGNGVAMGFNELYGALQTGVVDGAENNPPTLLAQNHYTVSKVYSLTGHLIIPEIFVFSKRTWDTLSKADQDAGEQALARSAVRAARAVGRVRRRGRDQAEGGRRAVRPGRQGGVLQGDAADPRQVRRQVRGAAEADRRHEVTQAVAKARGRPQRPRAFALPGSMRWTAKQRYRAAMEWLYIACIVLSGCALVVITLIIPLGVFMRYVMNSPLAWPEPAAIIMMVMFSFLGGAAVYRANVHIAVEALLNAVTPACGASCCGAWTLCMAAIALFMLGYGIQLCIATQYSTMAEFPAVSQGLVYLPIPVAGLLTLLFLIERVWVGDPPQTSFMYSDQAAELE